MQKNILGVVNFPPYFSTRGGSFSAVLIFFIRLLALALALAFALAAIGFWFFPFPPLAAKLELIRLGIFIGLVLTSLGLLSI